VNEIAASGDTEFKKLVEKTSRKLLARGWKMACAESCTGGWIAKCCTDLAGSSEWFERGYVTYSNQAKEEMLGVDSATLGTSGAVSREVALQMAEGARRQAGVEVAVAVTGIAGPDGGSPDKPVGTVWFGWSLPGRSDTAVLQFGGNRDAVRRQSVAQALAGLIDRLDS
jgi:nicotinamide-nucleotide amidase